MILAIDTSTALTSVAVVEAGHVVAARIHLDARRHAEVLAPMLRDVLQGIEPGAIAAVACGVGPGPYTGLRVGIASALAVGAAWGVPVHGLCSLDALAAALLVEADHVNGLRVATDARRREIYWARYDAGGRRLEGPLVSRPDDLDDIARRGPWAGHGAVVHRDDLREVVDSAESPESDTSSRLYPHACWVARRVEALLAAGVTTAASAMELSAHGDDGAPTSAALLGVDLLPARPLYLRRPDAAEPKR